MWLERLKWPTLLMLVFCVAALFRIPALSESFWIDEVMSAAIITDSWDVMLTRVGFTDVHPPGYYLLLKAWVLVWGESDIALRLLSFLAGMFTIWMVMLWVRHYTNWSIAFVAGVLLASLPFHVHYSVEVRSYALFTAAALSLAWASERWLRSPTRSSFWRLVILEVLTLYLHYYSLLVVVLLNLYVLSAKREKRLRIRWFQAQSIALAAFSAWVPLLLVQVFELPQVMKAHLSDELPFSRVLSSLSPLPSASPTTLSLLWGCGILAMAFLGSWWMRSEAQSENVPEHSCPPWGVRTLLVLSCVFLFSPLLAFSALPMSDAMAEAYLNQLPWSYLLIAVALILGAILTWQSKLDIRLALPLWLMLGGPLLVLILHQVQPMLFLRNLLVFVPFVVILAAFSLTKTPLSFQLVLSLLFFSAGLGSTGMGSEAFMPRQDFKGVAKALKKEGGVTLMVAPAWDAPGIARYRESPAPVPVMEAHDVARQASKGEPLVVLLARPERHDLAAREIEAALGPRWRLREMREFRGHRGAMRWLKYDDEVDSGPKPDSASGR